MTKQILLGGLMACAGIAQLEGSERILRAELTLGAPVAEVFRLWSTEEGVTSFFAPGCHIEPHVDGAYEIFFDPAATPGKRGAEGMRVLAYEQDKRLAFTWNAPPDQPLVRSQRTMVALDFEALTPTSTRLRFTHLGWGEGKEWDAAYAYFDRAWNTFVLPRLKRRVSSGPLSWTDTPDLPPAAATLRVTLEELPH